MDSIRCLKKHLLLRHILRTAFVLCIAVFIIAFFNGAVLAKYRVVIKDIDKVVTVYTSEPQPETILTQQNINLAPQDTFTFSGFSEDNQAQIEISRAMKVTIVADDAVKTAMMTECSVDQALEQFNVNVGDDDLMNVSPAEEIVDGMSIEINRVTYAQIVEQEEIPYDTNEIRTPTISDNNRKTLKAGRDGMLETTTSQKLVDGVVVDSEVVSTVITAEPISATVLVGDSDSAVSKLVPDADLVLDAKGNPVNYSQKIIGKATAYSARGRRTKLKPGNVAMDLSQFPKGTRLYIKTPDGDFIYGYSVVKDTGHALVNGDIMVDLFFDSYKESCLFGARTVEIYVL